MNILIIEDNKKDQLLLKAIISSAKKNGNFNREAKLTFAEKENESLNLLRNNSYDIIIVNLKVISIKNFNKAYFNNKPIIIIAGEYQKSVFIECLKNGTTRYVPKTKLWGQLLIKTINEAIIEDRSVKGIRGYVNA
jgi:CheY-like chemotaxis protein